MLAGDADCMSCHSAPGGKMFTGGEELKIIFPRHFDLNITPYVATGIRSWRKQDFRNGTSVGGVRKDGSPLYPVMPPCGLHNK
jgi:hypothetical protein